jgi:hypothetical protein
MAQVTFTGDTTPNQADLDANFTELYGKTAWSSTGIGYATGAGGTVTQATSKSTGVTLSKMTGQVTMHNASLAANTAVAFVVSNALVASSDCVVLNIASGVASATSYQVSVGTVSAGAFSIVLRNTTGGALAEAPAINFVVIKGAQS